MPAREYGSGVPAADGEQKYLHFDMFYRPNNNHATTGVEISPVQDNAPPPPPSYESLYPLPSYEPIPSPPPSYESLPPPPPAYEPFPTPPPYDSVFLAPPPYLPRTGSDLTCCSSCSSPHCRPILPPLSTMLSSMGAAPSSPPPPPYTPLPATTAPARFPVFHARYYGADRDDSSQDRHKLFVLTSADAEDHRARGIYICATPPTTTGNRPRFRETLGDVPENTRGLRECTLLGSVAAEDLDALGDIGRRVHLGRAAKDGAARTTRLLRKNVASCRFLIYTVDTPPPPYSTGRGAEPLLASPSQEWAAAVIALAKSSGLLQGI